MNKWFTGNKSDIPCPRIRPIYFLFQKMTTPICMNAHNNLENAFGDPKDYVGANLFGTSTDEGTPSWHFFPTRAAIVRHIL